MRPEELDLTDTERIRACHDVYLAAQRVDDPDGSRLSYRPFYGWLTVGWHREPREVWLVTGQAGGLDGGTAADPDGGTAADPDGGTAADPDDGTAADPDGGTSAGPVAGWYRLELPDLENLDRAHLDLIVRPQDRRRGLGRALLRHAAGRAAEHGRSVVSGTTWRGTAGDAFARSVGAKPGLIDIRRSLDLGKLPAGELARLRGPAERAAAGYSLLSWTGPVPDELLDQTAALYAAMGDAPHDPGVVRGVWDARRVRERVNDLFPHFGTCQYSVAARHDATGQMAALTQVAVDPVDPGQGYQMITAVTRDHRGHRLGLLVKIMMLELLAEAEPRLERIETFNAESNEHMIAVNETIGYTICGPPSARWLLDVGAALGWCRAG